MSQFTLKSGLFLYPTSAGAYYAVSAADSDKARRFLLKLLQQSNSPELNIEHLLQLTETDEPEKALQLLHHCQKLGWVQGLTEAIAAPQQALEELLPPLLSKVSETGKVLLADEQGFYLATSGFPHETAEELSALSAELASIHSRRAGLLTNNLGVASQAWGIVDAYGGSQIGFWPLFIGSHRFVLVVAGVPHFNHAEYVTLIWSLCVRYIHKDH